MNRPARTSSRRSTRPVSRSTTPARAGVENHALLELESWRRSAIPDATTPLDAEDLVRLLRECFADLRLDSAIVADVSVNTVHYYRRKDIIDPPVGKTAAARYDVHHLWQVAGARLAGFLGLVTLAEARDVIRGADENTSMAFLAARIADARARDTVRGTTSVSTTVTAMRPLPGVVHESNVPAVSTSATLIALPGNAWCVVPAGHAAHHSSVAASALVSALAAALRNIST